MQPQLSIATSFSYSIPVEEQMALAAEAGFTAISIGARPEHSGYLDHPIRQRLISALQQHELVVDTVHARGLGRPDAIAEATATVEAASSLGARCVVAHGGPFACGDDYPEMRVRSLVATCRSLAPVAKSCGVVFALENVMPGPATDLIKKALLELDITTFGLCYDSSHDQIDGPRPFDLIDQFRDRIFAVHLSDRIRPHVDHVIPGEGFIDWQRLCNNLKEARYSNPILMEVTTQHSRFQEPKVFLKEAYEAGRKIWQLVHGCRSVW